MVLLGFLNQERTWFTEIVFVKVCVCTYLHIYLSMFVRTQPCEQNH